MSPQEVIKYAVRGKIAIISLESPQNLNAQSFEHYQYLAELLEKGDAEPTTVITLLTSSGKYFSAGADIDRNSGPFNAKFDTARETRAFWLSKFMASNSYVTKAVYSHRKVLAVALNGPVIGLSAAIVALCDLVYAKDTEKLFMLLPFANLGLVTEGASATSLFHRLGISKANEALLLSRPIRGPDLLRVGFINKVYDGTGSVEAFNKQVEEELAKQVEGLNDESVLQIKQLIQSNVRQQLVSTNLEEAGLGLARFEQGIPQARFKALRSKQLKHKL